MDTKDLWSPGFKLVSFDQLGKWKPITIDPNIPLERSSVCFACGSALEKIAALVNNKKDLSLSLGCCTMCGIVTYIDRPNQKWLTDFYTHTWDNVTQPIENIAIKELKKPRASHFSHIAKSIGLKASDSILDIGSGYGGTLAALAELGYKNGIGLENSSHRAAIATDKRNINVLQGNFEGEITQRELHQRKPFDFILSAHVLEHIYNPNEFISKVADLQDVGGHIAIAVPNFTGEHAINILLFFPHLHSFTLTGLSCLIQKHGYTVVDVSRSTANELVVVGKKTKRATSKITHQENKVGKALQKITLELELQNIKPGKPYTIQWHTQHTKLKHGVRSMLATIRKQVSSLIHKHSIHREPIHKLTVEGLLIRKTSAPIEIQFSDNIILFYK